MGMTSVVAADRSVTGKRKAEGDSLDFEDMVLPRPLKPVLTVCTSSRTSKTLNDDGDFDNDGCETPKSEGHKIPECLDCPPAPRKPKPAAKRRPAGGFFFVPHDLDSVFLPYQIVRPRKKLHWSTTTATSTETALITDSLI